MAEELAAAPPELMAFVQGADREPSYVYVPALDWLSEDLRHRGLRFLTASIARTAEIPVPLRPALILDAPDPATPQVRFAHHARSNVPLDHNMDAIVDHVFGAYRFQAAAG